MVVVAGTHAERFNFSAAELSFWATAFHPSRPSGLPALAQTIYFEPRIWLSSIALPMPSGASESPPLCVELQRMPRSSICLRTSLASSVVQL